MDLKNYPPMMSQPQVCEAMNISRWTLAKRRPEMVRRGVIIHQSFGPHTHYKYERDSVEKFMKGTVTHKFMPQVINRQGEVEYV
jgi:hypothetical protein